ncbi:hypothetical protein PPYR_01562 [Photinus pyralis]|uniref:Uncharacterized protein n=1 Tax=Photinus pyralis TaxID=7054 RepID=A0A5N4B4S2_PHOPY|nr:hypothetical protein PPYR_01562 [Photinus pyralis]
MQSMKPTPASNHNTQKSTFQLKDIDTATHVYIRVDAAKRPLQAPYEGPYPVVTRNDKTTTIRRHGTDITVSNDRVKPAYQERDEEQADTSKVVPPSPAPLAKRPVGRPPKLSIPPAEAQTAKRPNYATLREFTT